MTKPKTLGVGILGYGFMGRTHAYAHRTIPFYYDPPPASVRMAAVCRSRADKLPAAIAEGGFQRGTTDFREVVEAEDVDIVHVCTPNDQHLPAIRAAVAAGKHLYVEKPVTATLAEADELAGLLAGYRGAAQTVLQYRFFPATLRARRLIDEGFLGPVTHFRAAYLHSGSVDPTKAVNWKSTAAAGGGVVRDLGVHVLDLLWWLIGPFDRACCTSRIWAPRRPSLDRPGEMMTIDAEEAAGILLTCPDGAFGAVEVSKIATGAEDELRFEIHGRNGAMRFNLMDPNWLEVFDGRDADGELGGDRGWKKLACVQRYPPPGGKFPSPKASIGWLRGHVHSLYCFLKAVADGTEASPSLKEGIHRQRVLEAVLRSAESGRWVDLPQCDR